MSVPNQIIARKKDKSKNESLITSRGQKTVRNRVILRVKHKIKGKGVTKSVQQPVQRSKSVAKLLTVFSLRLEGTYIVVRGETIAVDSETALSPE